MGPQTDSRLWDCAAFLPSFSHQSAAEQTLAHLCTAGSLRRMRKGQGTTGEKDLGGVRVNYPAALSTEEVRDVDVM